ncbi:glycosyltransferase family 25 protein [Xylariaceae sp. FL1651]|nr:glycosyltransferase family 25 protein [Xylariaceae sp. FL1651]
MESTSFTGMQNFPRSRRHHLPYWSIVVCLFLFFAFRLLPRIDYPKVPRTSPPVSSPFSSSSSPLRYLLPDVTPREAAANATLGFHKLLALSARPSWRTRGLEAAANLTGLSFSIPAQPQNAEEFVRAFEQIGAGVEGVTLPEHGAALAWVAHLDLLKHVIASGLASAFIVEDDVDWDVRLKDQMRLVSDNVRAYTHAPAEDTAPFGSDGWDVLWLGHCDSSVDHGNDDEAPAPAPRSYRDESRIDAALYTGWARPFVRDGIAPGHRVVQRAGRTTVCSFGFGVTRASAQKVLALLGGGGGEAFDVHLATRCREGKLRCLVVNPQVFNHYEPPADESGAAATTTTTSLVRAGNGGEAEADEAGFEHRPGTTGNIVRSARCRALFDRTCLRRPPDDNTAS